MQNDPEWCYHIATVCTSLITFFDIVLGTGDILYILDKKNVMALQYYRFFWLVNVRFCYLRVNVA